MTALSHDETMHRCVSPLLACIAAAKVQLTRTAVALLVQDYSYTCHFMHSIHATR